MITREDVERLVVAHERVREALEKNRPRRAARFLCDDLNWLVNEKGSFWADVRDATNQRVDHREAEREVLNSITRLLEDEESIFARLGIEASQSGPIIASVYGSINLIANNTIGIGQSPDELMRWQEGLGVLQERLGRVRDLICQEATGPVRQALNWVISWRGAGILAGTAVAMANTLVDIGGLGSLSIKVGTAVIRRDIQGLIDIFENI